ncbi:MAG: hypothetical protein LBK06_04770 [Planctomycetaceae bacterium]|nr:hypothetical protein [Planctomycetaceae bacterium]
MAAQQRGAVVQGRSLLPYRLRYKSYFTRYKPKVSTHLFFDFRGSSGVRNC